MSIEYNLESPKTNVIKYGVINVEGWAFSHNSRLKSVEVKLNDRVYKAKVGIQRPDVENAFAEYAENVAGAGFVLSVNLKNEKIIEDKVKIEITIFTETEKLELPSFIMSETVFVPAVIEPKRMDSFKWFVSKSINYVRANGIHVKKRTIRRGWNMLKGIICSSNQAVDIIDRKKKSENLYDSWVERNTIKESDTAKYKTMVDQMEYQPLISIIMPAYNSDTVLLEEAIKSVQDQFYTNWELVVIDDASASDDVERTVLKLIETDDRIRFYRLEKNSNISYATNYGVECAQGEFVFLMDHDDLLTKDSLFEVISALNINSNLDIIYSDDDKISMEGRRYAPQFKPDFSPELLLSYMYFSHIFVIRKNLFERAGGCRIGYEGSQDFDLALRVTELTNEIYHIPKVLYHWRAAPTSTALSTDTKPKSIERGLKAVEDAIVRRNIPAKAIQPKFAEDGKLGIFSLKYCDVVFPKISIIIPTKNHIKILKRCIDSIEKLTTYPDYEIVIVDNCSDEEETKDYLKGIEAKHKLIEVDNVDGRFNFSHMVNEGVKASSGEYIVLLNNDTEIITKDWLEAMLGYMKISGVGAVGAKLLYPDKTVQHAGVVLGVLNGVAGHAFKLIPEWDGGYLSYAKVARNYSAVTGACLMTAKDLYVQLDGFDEHDLAVSFNDVDFCLRVRQKGFRVVYAPEAMLYHHEGKSRGTEQTGHFSDAKEAYLLTKKWEINKKPDPYYNVNLTLKDESFAINPTMKWTGMHKSSARILLMTHNLNYEGAPLVVYQICKGLVKRGYQFFVLSPVEGALRDLYEELGVEVKVVPDFKCVEFTNLDVLNKAVERVAESYQEKHIDLVLTNTIEMFHGVNLAEKMNVPVAWIVHESIDYRIQFMDLGPQIHNEFLRAFQKADAVIFVANATKQLFQPLANNNFFTIRNGLDLDALEKYAGLNTRENVRDDLQYEKDVKVITIVGTVCMRKGQKDFVKVAEKVIKKRKSGVKFVIVGASPSAYLDEVLAEIKQYGIQEYVDIVPVTKDVNKYYMASDICVCSSYEESAPMIILEAMAFKRNIVSTDVFGIPELVRDKQEAMLCKAGDIDQMADNLIKVLDDDDMAGCMRYNAYYRVKKDFDLSCMLDGYECLFKQIM